MPSRTGANTIVAANIAKFMERMKRTERPAAIGHDQAARFGEKSNMLSDHCNTYIPARNQQHTTKIALQYITTEVPTVKMYKAFER